MMQIHLIADRSCLAFSRTLIEYIEPYLGRVSKFHLHEWEGDVQYYWTWEELFFAGKTYRDHIGFLGKSSEDNYFVFLFDGENELNWFAAHDPEAANVAFVQCSGWEQLDFDRPIYPVAYHLAAMLLIIKYFGKEEPLDFHHQKSRGCMFDFTQKKEEVRFKFQSAHICKACISKISERAKSKTEAIDLISAVLALFKSIKEYLFPLDLQAYFGQMEYRLLINLNKEFVLRIDNRNIKIDLSNGWGKAIYMILLKYPKGLRYQDFESEKILREFLGIYYRFCSGGDSLESLYRLSRSQIEQKLFRSNLYTYVSKVKKELKSALAAYPDVYKLMDIQVLNGRLLIKINRGFVETHLNGYQL